MNISSMNAGTLPAVQSPQQNAGADAKIRSLEQKLQQLNTERERAAQRGDEKKKKELEAKIEEIKKQIERLKQQEGKQEPAPDENETQKAVQLPGSGGESIDFFA